MSTLQTSPEPKGSWFSFTLKIAFFIIAFFLIIFTVLANMGGSGEAMKQAVESFFSEATGYRASIHKFNRMIFFPDIVIDFERMDLLTGEDGTTPVATVGQLQLAMSFWDVMLSTGKIRKLNLEDVVINAGVVLPAAINIETARIFDEGGDKALLEIKGFIDKNPLEVKADMKAFGTAPWKTYRFGSERHVTVKLGALEARGLVKSNLHEEFSFEEIKAVMPESTLEGFFAVRNRGYRNFAIEGELRIAENGTILQPDLTFDLEKFPPHLTGTLKIPVLNFADFKDGSRFNRLHNFVRDNIAGDIDPDFTADLKIDIAAAHGLSGWLGPQNTKQLLPDYSDGQGFQCISLAGQVAGSDLTLSSVFVDSGVQILAAAGSYDDEKGADLAIQAQEQSFHLSGKFPGPSLKPGKAEDVPEGRGACAEDVSP